MAEIKSTIDLVMEKTKGLTLSEEEKERLEDEKEYRAAHGLVNRFLHGDVALQELLHQGEASSAVFQQAIFRSLVEGLQLGREKFSRGVEALERFKGSECRAPLKRLRDLSIQFRKTLKKRKQKVRSELWAELACQGVEGSAVEPNVEVSPQWKATIQALEQEFAPRLGEIQNALLTQLGIADAKGN